VQLLSSAGKKRCALVIHPRRGPREEFSPAGRRRGRGRGASELLFFIESKGASELGRWGLGTGAWELGYFLAIVFICYRWERLHSVRVSFEPDFLLAIVFLFVGLFVWSEFSWQNWFDR
jgi:hypothetical protein